MGTRLEEKQGCKRKIKLFGHIIRLQIYMEHIRRESSGQEWKRRTVGEDIEVVMQIVGCRS